MSKPKTLMRRFIEWSIAQKEKAHLTCEICQEQKQKSRELVCHHIIPVKKSGVNAPLLMEERNILVLCHRCHNLIHGTYGTKAELGEEFHWGGSLSMIYDFSNLQQHLSRIVHEYHVNV